MWTAILAILAIACLIIGCWLGFSRNIWRPAMILIILGVLFGGGAYAHHRMVQPSNRAKTEKVEKHTSQRASNAKQQTRNAGDKASNAAKNKANQEQQQNKPKQKKASGIMHHMVKHPADILVSVFVIFCLLAWCLDE